MPDVKINLSKLNQTFAKHVEGWNFTDEQFEKKLQEDEFFRNKVHEKAFQNIEGFYDLETFTSMVKKKVRTTLFQDLEGRLSRLLRKLSFLLPRVGNRRPMV